ncbi:MAG: sulfite exporter TauE/SafE family protein [Dehalococcoidales bacterium]|nr:sulfite exporter TauE/SafE family protein [Dehalococcoidales bacterium]
MSGTGETTAKRKFKLFQSPWLELSVLCLSVVLSYAALLMISKGAEIPPGGMAMSNITWLLIGFFVLSFAIAVIAVLAGIGGGVIYSPLMLAFTPVDSLIIRATGLVVAMFSGIVSSGLFMKTGIANFKVSIFSTLGYGLGGFVGAQGAIYVARNMGASGEGAIRIILACIVLLLVVYFILGGRKMEWPVVKRVDRFSRWLGLRQPYYEQSTNEVVDYQVTRAGWGLFCVFCIGLVSGFFGMGAGWAIVPGLNLVMGIPLKVAAASSGVIIGMGDCITLWPYLLIGAIIPLFVAPWLVGQILGGILGAHVLIKAKSKAIRYILIGIMFYTSFGLFANAFIKIGLIANVSGAVYLIVLGIVLVLTILAITEKLPRLRKGE